VLLDLLFVLALGWGVQGVALASVISEFVALVFASWLVMRNLNRLGGQWAL
jgi:MATE family multidrug resistance protein